MISHFSSEKDQSEAPPVTHEFTLAEVLEDYLSTEAMQESTKIKYRYLLNSKCSQLLGRPISYFTEEVRAQLRIVMRFPGGAHDKPPTTIVDTLVKYADRKRQLAEYAKPNHNAVQSDEITLLRVYTDYLATGLLKPKTQQNYRQRLSHHLPDWMNLPVSKITKQMVEDRHREISVNTPSMANSVFRTLKALLNYASIKYEDSEGLPIVRANPTRRLSELKQWNTDFRRTSVVEIKEVGLFFRTVWTLNDKTARDILLTLLCTGLRYGEVSTLEWTQLDLKLGLLMIPREKSKNNEPLVIPLSDFVWRLLAERRFGAENGYVFPGRYAKNSENSIANIQKSINLVKAR
jgi:integrase